MAEAEAAMAEIPRLTRREFLYYIWGASMALTTAGSTGAVLWFAFPIPRAGEFGSEFRKPIDELPEVGAAPKAFESLKIWLINTDRGILTVFKVCTHLGCLYKWVPTNARFECPCHGSKFQLDGTWIEGPAPRSLDRFAAVIEDEEGNELARTDEQGNPLEVPSGAAFIVVDTSQRPIKGELNN